MTVMESSGAGRELSIEEASNLEQRRDEILNGYKKYMDEHPELRQALNDFISACLAERPTNVYKFSRYWFKTSLPPLRPPTAAVHTPPVNHSTQYSHDHSAVGTREEQRGAT